MIPPAHMQAVLDLWRTRGERTCIPIEGDCMAPAIQDGDVMIVDNGKRRLHPGDIVLFRAPDRMRVQRIIRVAMNGGKREFVLKGDQSALWPVPVTEDAVAGKVIGIRGRRGVVSFESPSWRVLNRVLVWRSVLLTQCANRRAASGRLANALFAVRARFGNRERSLSLQPVRILRRLTESRGKGAV